MKLPVFLMIFALAGACKPSKTTTTDQKPTTSEVTPAPTNHPKGDIGIAFYNVENLYDTENDPKTDDEEFTPESKLNWTEDKYRIKLGNLAKVISQLSDDGPEIFGLVEIENATVVRDLLNQDLLKKQGYKFVQEDSKDARGVDVALCYDPSVFQYVRHKAYTPKFAPSNKKTRDFLLVEGKIKGETTYFIVNHWPSRREGQAESETYRVQVAEQVKHVCDSVLKQNPKSAICIMGDFNDDPTDKSIAVTIGAKKTVSEAKNGYYNPLSQIHNAETEGSLEYNGKWNMFDQFILSSNFFNGKTKVQYVPNSAKVFHPEWLRVGYGKSKDSPRRSVFKDQFRDDGYSDHFPVEMKLKLQ